MCDIKEINLFFAHFAIILKELELLEDNDAIIKFYQKNKETLDRTNDAVLTAKLSEVVDFDRILVSLAKTFSTSLEDKEQYLSYLLFLTYPDLQYSLLAKFIIEQQAYQILSETTRDPMYMFNFKTNDKVNYRVLVGDEKFKQQVCYLVDEQGADLDYVIVLFDKIKMPERSLETMILH